MTKLENTDYQLVQLSEAERQELILARRDEINDQFNIFNKRLFDKISSYLGDTPNDIKTILALNSLLQREFNQHEAYPLAGFEQTLHGIRDTTILANNNFIYGENNIATETAVYLVIEPEVVAPEEGEDYLSNNEKIKRATEVFDLDRIPYKLYLFLNTDKYDIYSAIEEDLKSSQSKEFEIISVFPNMKMRSLAEVTVDFFPESSVYEIANSFLSAFGLFPHRRKKVYFDYSAEKKTEAFGAFDFLLLAQSHLPNLMLEPQIVDSLAKHFTKLWLAENSTFKHRHEEIEDFFHAPSTVLIKGMSPVYGFITGRKLTVKGAKIDPSTGEEQLLAFELDTEAEIAGLYDEQELGIYLKHNPANLRNALVRWKHDVIRVTSIEKTLNIQGKNLNGSTKSSKYTLTGDLDELTFLTPFYREIYYNNFLKNVDNLTPYHLPERFKMYLLRSASYKGIDVPEVDSKWFSKTNRSLTEVLSMLDDKFHLDNILGYDISPVHGIVNKKILVSLEGLKCLTREK